MAVIIPWQVAAMALALLVCTRDNLASQSRGRGPDPSISRPPLLLTLPAAEAERQVRALAYSTILQAMQSGDPELIEMALGDLVVDEPGADPTCTTLGEASRRAAVAAQAARNLNPGTGVPIYPEAVAERDSAGWVIADIRVLVASNDQTRLHESIRLLWSQESGASAARGILKVLCATDRRTP